MEESLVRRNALLVFIICFCNAEFLHQEYFTDAILSCDTAENETNGNPLEVSNRYWLLTDGSLVNKASQLDKQYTIDANFTLHISRISDENFGIYYCILVLNDSSLHMHRHGLNVDGASFDSLNQSYGTRAVAGVIAAASVFVLMLGLYIIYRVCFSKKAKRKKMILEDLNKGINRFSTQFYDNVGFEVYTKRSSSMNNAS